jgi:hypothetical protein
MLRAVWEWLVAHAWWAIAAFGVLWVVFPDDVDPSDPVDRVVIALVVLLLSVLHRAWKDRRTDQSRGEPASRSAVWFDSPFWRDWLFWVSLVVSLLLLSWWWHAGTMSTDGEPSPGPDWLAVPVAALPLAWVVGYLPGCARIFVRELRRQGHEPGLAD